jgi:hypothetical protein
MNERRGKNSFNPMRPLKESALFGEQPFSWFVQDAEEGLTGGGGARCTAAVQGFSVS